MKLFIMSLFTLSLFMRPQTTWAAKKNLEDMELKWTPTSDLNKLVAADLGSVKGSVQINQFKDARKVEPQNKMGENLEEKDKGIVLLVKTPTNVSAFLTDNLKQILKKSGLNVVESGGDYILTGSINEYFVTEVNTYKGSLFANVTLSKKDVVLWKGTAVGTNTRFGRSYSAENYRESFSDLIIGFATSLFENHDFRAKLQ
jgi:hypothetical protein